MVQLYWNLVAAISTVNVNKQAVAVAQKLYDDNKKQVEIGTLAPIEVVRAEAQLATAQQALVAAQSSVLQLESVLKSALSRNGLMSHAILDAHVVPYRSDSHSGSRGDRAHPGSGVQGLG